MSDFLNIEGTLRSIFSLGKSSNKVTIQSNSGTLEGKNFGGVFSKILLGGNNLNDVSNKNTSLNNLLPSQTGNTSKILTTDGTDTSWSSIDSLPASKVLVKNTSTQAIQGGVYTKVLFPTEVTDTLSEFSSSTFTSLSTQTVLVSASFSGTGFGNDRLLYLYIYKNGSTYIHALENSGGGATGGLVCVNISFPIDVVANDTLEIYARHTDGSNNRNLDGNQILSIIKLR